MILRTIVLALILVVIHGCIDNHSTKASSDYTETVGKWGSGNVYKVRDGCKILYIAAEAGGYSDARIYKPAIALGTSECPVKISK